MAREPGLSAGETMLGVTTPAFDLSVPDLYLPLVTGATLLLATREEAARPAGRSPQLLDDEWSYLDAGDPLDLADAARGRLDADAADASGGRGRGRCRRSWRRSCAT